MNMPIGLMYIYKYMDMIGEIEDYDEWTLDNGDYNVKIDHCITYYGREYSELKYEHSVGYLMYTDQDLQDAKNEKKEQNQQVDDDL